jgi:peptidoglycan/LPS O-acetylase OafA/YrhL
MEEVVRKVAPSPFIPEFQGLRGILAFWVMICHTGYFVGLSAFTADDWHYYPKSLVAVAINYLGQSGWDAVNIFMILSGFVITRLLYQEEKYILFLKRRFFRIWPVFILATLCGLLSYQFYIEFLKTTPFAIHNSWLNKQLEWAIPPYENSTPYLLVHATMLHGLVTYSQLPYASAAFLSLSWCISTEWQFYLCARPLFLGLTSRYLGVIIPVISLLLMTPACESRWSWHNPNTSFLAFQSCWFLFGMLSYLATTSSVEYNDGRRYMKIFLAYLVCASLIKPRISIDLLAWVALLVLIFPGSFGATPFSKSLSVLCRILKHPVVMKLGDISYPLYLLHWPITVMSCYICAAYFPSLGRWATYLIALLITTCLSLPISQLVVTYLEQPIIRLGNSKTTRPK